MIYITEMQNEKVKQLTWEDIINGVDTYSSLTQNEGYLTATRTTKYPEAPPEYLEKINVNGMINWLKTFNSQNEYLFAKDRKELYHTFKIPKKTGGFREINAPCEELKIEMNRLVDFLKNKCCVLYHTSAYAYIKGRSIVDNSRRHQANESNWYLKTDFSGFFPSTTVEFSMKMMSMVFPLSEVCKREDGYEALAKAISLSFINDSLVMGSPLSPMLTNTIMIPIDHKLFAELAKRKIVYSRYADDMFISAKENFPWKEIVRLVEDILKEFGAPYLIKREKTHYGSRKGNNWCLGLMINKDNNITVGHEKKKYFKSALCSFILDTTKGKTWDIEDVYHLRGLISYYKMVEPEYFDSIISQQNKKWNVDVNNLFKKYC